MWFGDHARPGGWWEKAGTRFTQRTARQTSPRRRDKRPSWTATSCSQYDADGDFYLVRGQALNIINRSGMKNWSWRRKLGPISASLTMTVLGVGHLIDFKWDKTFIGSGIRPTTGSRPAFMDGTTRWWTLTIHSSTLFCKRNCALNYCMIFKKIVLVHLVEFL